MQRYYHISKVWKRKIYAATILLMLQRISILPKYSFQFHITHYWHQLPDL